MSFFDWFRSDPNIAAKLGFTAEEVQRETPLLNNDGTLDSFAKDKCKKYSIARPGGRYGDWQLLQRFPKDDSRLPNGFVVTGTNVTPELIEKLRPLATDYNVDYFEFERAGDLISVYCWISNKSDLTKLAASIAALQA